ncbi:MAG: YdcF family protein [Bacteroidales bacterium]|nr:YdcF family protein [Candidatus Colicola faecequi]
MMTVVLIIVLLLIVLAIFVLRGVYRRWGAVALVAGLVIAGLGCLGLAGVMYCCDRTIMRAADGRCFDRAEDLPASQWGILFGTGRNRRANEYYDSRLAAAIELYQTGKISFVFISGENLHKDYQEVDSMYQAMLAIGVPPERIVCDTAGRDTYSTLLHARELADTTRVILISQRFHNERALYYAEQMQIDALAYNAAPNSVWYKRLRDYAREKLARVKAILKNQLASPAAALAELKQQHETTLLHISFAAANRSKAQDLRLR